MNVTKIMWAYMFMYGVPGKPSYYGGVDQDNKDYNIKGVGIDWKATKEPFSDTYASFDGTDCDPSRKEFLNGCLVLKNGKKINYCHPHSTMNGMLHAMTALQNEVATNPIYLD